VPKKAAKNNIIPLPKKKKPKNITLDKRPDGTLITELNHYRKDLQRWLTIDDCLLIEPSLLKKRTWESWRARYKESGDEIGPKFKIFGLAIIKIKVIWLSRYVYGYGWQQQPQPTAANNSDQQKSASGNI
jgi:transposase